MQFRRMQKLSLSVYHLCMSRITLVLPEGCTHRFHRMPAWLAQHMQHAQRRIQVERPNLHADEPRKVNGAFRVHAALYCFYAP